MANTPSLKEQAFSYVIIAIIKGEYTTESIITEKELCSKLQMSKSPVRDALVDLCSQRILRSIPRHGYVVVQYTERDIYDLIQYRIFLECGALDECFENITPTQLCLLSNVVDLEFTTLRNKDISDYWKDTLNFHLTLVSFSGNEFIYNQLKSAISTALRAYLQLYWKNISLLKPSQIHAEIVQAIRAGNKVQAIELLKKDIRLIFDENSTGITD